MNKQVLERFKEYLSITRFNAIKISIASPEKIKYLSYGEVSKIETINYRTLKPEKDGLFCARIFGPVKDWECNCGKYKRMKHRGVTCEKCGVEVIQARVRRERMGHIELVSPVVHIWYLKGIPSYLSLILDMTVKDLERVVYFDAYMVIAQGLSPYIPRTLLTLTEYLDYTETRVEDLAFKAETGAEALLQILKDLDLNLEIAHLKKSYSATTSVAIRHRLVRRMKVINSLMQSNIRPEWMIMKVLPMLPPDLRPLVPLEGGRFASSDLNELYRRVLNRNIRLQRLIEIEAPAVIIKNEKRMLQESVDALIDNGRRGQAVRGSNKRPLKSLSEMLRGKQGRFRQNLLGRRVDYSGRSVIVVDPELRLDQCGLPKLMALELFKPYVYAGLMERETVPNMRVARRLVDELDPMVWDVLEDVVRDRPIILNRAPTLHRLGIQAFYPLLVDGKAIKIHPLVCHAFNADFDGDQMAVHIPLSQKAQLETKNLILSSRNILSPANGRPLTCPSQDMVLGLYYITKVRIGARGENTVFRSVAEVISAFQCEAVELHALIKVRIKADEDLVTTTVGRILLYDSLPEGSSFFWINKVMNKNDLAKMVERVYHRFELEKVVETLDKVKKLGFYYATHAGISISIDNLIIPEEKDAVISQADHEVEKVEKLYMDGVITNGERRSKVISIWYHATSTIATAMYKKFEEDDKRAFVNEDRSFEPFNPIFMMLDSGARGTKDQIKQLVGMRGAMAKPNGDVIENPVKSNFKEGLKVFEYFISTHGARKGQSDVALKTANSGYLTRRLVDVAHDLVVTVEDCRTLGYIEMEDLKDAGEIICPLFERVLGRTVAADVKDMITGELLLKQGAIITRDDLPGLSTAAVYKIAVRSVLTCQAKRGVCAYCYGYDLSKSALVDIGTPVGIIAAQSIGEPGTQLTMRTFHIGGTASGLGEQSFFAAKNEGIIQWKGVRVVRDRDGNFKVISRRARIAITLKDGREVQQNNVEYGSTIYVEDKQAVTVGTKLVEWDPNNQTVLTDVTGKVSFVDLQENITFQERFDEATKKSDFVVLETRGEKYQPAFAIMNHEDEEISRFYLPAGARLNVVAGQKVEAGDILVKIPREASKTKDITGGLPRIAELFEARAPKDPTIIADIEGRVVIGGVHRGYRKISLVSGEETRDYLIPRGKQLNVVDGERVSVGDFLTSGLPVLQDILQIMGPDIAQRYLVDQVEQIYRLQGVSINAKHYELIVRQMTRKVRVVERGDSDFMIGDRVDRVHFQMVNSALRAESKKTAVARSVLQGLTQASLGTESFISAASFQETTKILAESAIAGQIDYLYGLKENVIVGKVIPAGTGLESFRVKYLGQEYSDLQIQAHKEEQTLLAQ